MSADSGPPIMLHFHLAGRFTYRLMVEVGMVNELFSYEDMESYLKRLLECIRKDVQMMDPDSISTKGLEVVIGTLYKKYVLKPVSVDREKVETTQTDKYGEWRISFSVPFTGDRDLLRCRPLPYQIMESGRVDEYEIVMEIEGKIGTTRFNFEAWWQALVVNIGRANNKAEKFNNTLLVKIKYIVEARLDDARSAKDDMDRMGFP